MQFVVTCTFKFFVNYFVHLGTRVNQAGGYDGQASTFFNVTCGTKETFWSLECVRVHTASQDLP